MANLQGRPLLINFWATWCPPCVREMPLLNSFYRQHQANGLQMIGIAVDSVKPVAAFLERNPVDFPILLAGADGSGLARTLGNTGGGLPYTLLVNARGAVVHRQMGELQAQRLAEWAQSIG
jgi:thiol-disulfide isomerase/thioredoxin